MNQQWTARPKKTEQQINEKVPKFSDNLETGIHDSLTNVTSKDYQTLPNEDVIRPRSRSLYHCTMAQAMEIEGSKIQKSKTSFYLQF